MRMYTKILFALVYVSSAFGADKPNIVIYLADDHGRAESSVYGSSEVRTPMMASLAKDGLVFDNAFVASPACGPSRSALLSGLMPVLTKKQVSHYIFHYNFHMKPTFSGVSPNRLKSDFLSI